jgi:hypothetical protein
MVYRTGELRAEPAAREADDAGGWPGFGGNDVVVTAMSLGARRCGNDVVERPFAAVAGGHRTGRRGESGRNDVYIRYLLDLAGWIVHRTANTQLAPRLEFEGERCLLAH